MTDLALNLDSRYLAAIPEYLAIADDLKGPVTFFDPSAGFEEISYLQKNIYSMNCRTEILLPRSGLGAKPIVVNDLRMCEIALELIKASLQETVESQSDLMYLTISRIVLEQCALYSSPVFQSGLYIDRLNLEAIDETLRRKHKISLIHLSDKEERYHLEQIVQYMLIHEVTHYCFFADEKFRNDWNSKAKYIFQEVAFTYDGENDAEQTENNFLKKIINVRLTDIQAWNECGSICNDLEESICDISAIISLAHVFHRKRTTQKNLDGLMLSIWAALAATWLITMVKITVENLITVGSAEVSGMSKALQERAGVALLILGQTVTKMLREDGEDISSRFVADAWRKQPDFETLILNNFNSLFAADNLERILEIGSAALEDGLSNAKVVRSAIQKHFCWI